MTLLSVDEAQQRVLETGERLAPVQVPLCDALGRFLAEDVSSDLDMPPFDKALVDGFAVRSADLDSGSAELEVMGELCAGDAPWPADQALAAAQAARIMTGAPLPPGADAVVMIERTESPPRASAGSAAAVRIRDAQFKPGQNILRRGAELTRGQCVLRAGQRLRPSEIGVLAAVGFANVSVYRPPTVAIVSTGNEIVEAHQSPGPGQIRNSNGPAIAALVARAGAKPNYLGIARDTLDDLRHLVRQGLDADVLVLSGGVSAGDLDLVPKILAEFGVREVFHKVNLKPGKPVWFGMVPRQPRDVEHDDDPVDCRVANRPCPKLVFGLPGNPVSVLVCFELFVRPALRHMMGNPQPLPRSIGARLAADASNRSDRPTYWPGLIDWTSDGPAVRLVAWKGSPDLRATTESDSFVLLPAGARQYRAGDRVQVLTLE